MDHPSSRYYLFCQTIGWGIVTLTLFIFSFNHSLIPILEFILPGLLITHLLRRIIRHYDWLDLPIGQSLAHLVPALFLALMVAALIHSSFLSHPHFPGRLLACFAEYTFVLSPWLIIYFGIHQIRHTRENTKRIQRLEDLVKKHESPDTGPVIEPEDLTGELDRIRSLIDTDPDSARREITIFSRLLRSGHLKS
jgi:hypothetical protein